MSTGLQDKRRRPSGQTLAQEIADRLGINIEDLPYYIDIAEYPEWLLVAAFDAIEEAFDQDYWLDIVETTRRDIKRTVEDAVQQGMSARQVASEITDRHGDEYTTARALNVARTESANSQNAGHKSAMRQIERETGIQIRSEWLSVLSSTSREEHMDRDGVLSDDEGMFDLAGYRIPYPGHWSLPASQRCNCMCTIIAAPVADSLEEEDTE